MIAIKENSIGEDRYFKNTLAFSQREKASSGFRLRSPLLGEEPCPLKPSNGFFQYLSSSIIFYHKILDDSTNKIDKVKI